MCQQQRGGNLSLSPSLLWPQPSLLHSPGPWVMFLKIFFLCGNHSVLPPAMVTDVPIGMYPGTAQDSQELRQKPSFLSCVPSLGTCRATLGVSGSSQGRLQLAGLLAVFITKIFHHRLHLAGAVGVLGRQSTWLPQLVGK